MNWEPSKEVNPESSYVTTKKPDLFCPQFSRHLARVARGLWSPEEHEKAVAKRFEELQTASEALNTKPSRVKPVMIGRSREVGGQIGPSFSTPTSCRSTSCHENDFVRGDDMAYWVSNLTKMFFMNYSRTLILFVCSHLFLIRKR